MSFVRAHALTVTMFWSTVAWQFVFVSLPFHVQAISVLAAMTLICLPAIGFGLRRPMARPT